MNHMMVALPHLRETGPTTHNNSFKVQRLQLPTQPLTLPVNGNAYKQPALTSTHASMPPAAIIPEVGGRTVHVTPSVAVASSVTVCAWVLVTV